AGNFRKSALRRTLVCAPLVFFASLANAALTLTVSPTVSHDGSYTVSWTGGTTFIKLYDQSGNLLGATLPANGSYPVSGKTPGTYGYYAQDCYHPPVNSPPTCSTTTGTVTVTVPGTPVVAANSRMAAQIDGTNSPYDH